LTFFYLLLQNFVTALDSLRLALQSWRGLTDRRRLQNDTYTAHSRHESNGKCRRLVKSVVNGRTLLWLNDGTMFVRWCRTVRRLFVCLSAVGSVPYWYMALTLSTVAIFSTHPSYIRLVCPPS